MRLGYILAVFAVALAVSAAFFRLSFMTQEAAAEYRRLGSAQQYASEHLREELSEGGGDARGQARRILAHLDSEEAQLGWCQDTDAFGAAAGKGLRALAPDRLSGWLPAAQALGRLCAETDALGTRIRGAAHAVLAATQEQRPPPAAPILEATPLQQAMTTYDMRSAELGAQVLLVTQRLSFLHNTLVSFASLMVALIGVALFHVHKRLRETPQEGESWHLDRVSSRLRAALGASAEGFAIFDRDNRLVICNERYKEMSHANPEEVRYGMTLQEILKSAMKSGHYAIEHQKDRYFIQDHHRHFTHAGAQMERQLELSGDRHIIVRVNRTEFGDKVVARSDITELVRSDRSHRRLAQALQDAKDRMEQQSLTDPLTRLANRRALDRELARRLSEGAVTLIRIDLDRFKKVNDILGHDAGDFVLCHVSDVLRRKTGDGDLLARVGGDEFVVLCAPGITLAQAETLAQDVLKAVLEPVSYGAKRCNFGASFGVAGSEGSDDIGASELLCNADAALYKAKASGRAAVELFTPAMRQAAVMERALADRLPRAIEEGEIVPFYHTQHDARSWELAGVEVLARWDHPEEGVLPPSRFLGLAKQLGLEAELDACIFSSAVQQIQSLEAGDIYVPRVAFNVSAPRIMQPNFIDVVQAELPQERDRYVFEILETISCEEEGEALLFCIDALKDLGFQVDVDDFGSGHASINGVLNVAPHAIKIDRNIIFPLGQSERAERMVASVVDLAHSLDVKIIAEGVDSLEKARLLRRLGCDTLQGFFFSRPRSFEDFRASMGDILAIRSGS